MRFKLDENFGTKICQLFQGEEHDVQTIRSQKLQGSADEVIFSVCCAEKRCLVTLDLDFADVLRFPPSKASGIAVIRVPRNPSYALLKLLVRELLTALATMSPEKKLWIVEVGRIRIHEDKDI